VLLQLLDDGRLTDGHGRTVDFKNTVVIMTSNIGSQHIQELKGKDEGEMRKMVMEALRSQFRPEFLNRVDDLIIFHPLGIEQLKNIVEIQLKHLMKRLADKKIVVELTEKAKEYLANEGFDPIYGARPLKRIIQRDIQNPLALKLIDGTFKEGDKVKIGAEKGKLVFEKAK